MIVDDIDVRQFKLSSIEKGFRSVSHHFGTHPFPLTHHVALEIIEAVDYGAIRVVALFNLGAGVRFHI
jgi:hypothetical protein